MTDAMTTPTCAKHRCPVRECENVKLAGHERWRDIVGDIGITAFKAFVGGYLALIVAGVIVVTVAVGWALIRAATGH